MYSIGTFVLSLGFRIYLCVTKWNKDTNSTLPSVSQLNMNIFCVEFYAISIPFLVFEHNIIIDIVYFLLVLMS